jgi:hypothetical protein
MSGKKIKNNSSNTEKNEVTHCPKCNQIKKHTMYVNNKTKAKGMCTSCKCGIINKKGVKVAETI